MNNGDRHIDLSSIPEVISSLEALPPGKPILVDFDETLLLGNSTKEYLNSLYPRQLGVLLLLGLNYVRPWNWLPSQYKGEVSKDWLKVIVATIFFPWTFIVWQRRAKYLAHNCINTKLQQALTNSAGKTIIATLGFDPIVGSIIKHLEMPIDSVVACRFWRGIVDRAKGKDVLVREALGEETVANSMVITDSLNDLALLSIVDKPYFVVWSEVSQITIPNVYVPFYYLEKFERSGTKFFKQILTEELLILLVALSWLSPQPVWHAVGITVLLLSLWCIYEVGYWQSDRLSEQLEQRSNLSADERASEYEIPFLQPWLWSLCLAFFGTILLEIGKSPNNLALSSSLDLLAKPFLLDIKNWFGLLLSARGIFWLFDRAKVGTKIWLYPLLQGTRYFGFVCVSATNLVGTMLFVAQIVSCWLPYFIDRWSEDKIELPSPFPKRLTRFYLLVLLLTALAIGDRSWFFIFNWQTAIGVGLSGLLATKDLKL